MENEPEKPRSSVPPPPDIPPPPDLPPPPPPSAPPPPREAPVSLAKDEPEELGGEVGNRALPAGAEAPFDTRLIAGVLDGIVGGILSSLLGMIAWPVGWAAYIGFFLVRDALPFLDGQSPGKWLMKLRAVDAEGKSLSGNWGVSITRNIMMLPFLNLYEAYILYQKKEQGSLLRRKGDEMARTKVIVVAAPDPAV